MAQLTLRLLGEPTLHFHDKARKLPAPPRCVSLLALLAMRREPVSRAVLAATLWPDELESSARSNLRRHLYQIQHGLPKVDGVEWVLADSVNVTWNVDAPAWVDVNEFEQGVLDPARRAGAIELYRGDLLEGSYDEFLFADRERLRTLYIRACFDAAAATRRDLQFREAIGYAERILAMDEWREDALRLSMTLRYESGDRSSALTQYERFVKRLSAEMSVPPMPETLALRDAILTNTPVSTAASEEPGRGSAAPLRMPFVGRQSELATLDAAWRHAAAGRGTTLFLSGEAGIGKSRIVSELSATIGAQGGRVLFGETSNPQAYPYEPIVDALRRGLTFLLESPPGGPYLAAIAELLPELHAAFPELVASEPIDEPKARTRLFEAIARAFERLARARPLLLVLEDLHWAPTTTLEALEALSRRIATVPALVIVTYRSGEVTPGHPLSALRRRLQSERMATSLELGVLRPGDVDELVEKMGQSADRALRDAVRSSSEGNPLFAGLLLRNYAENGVLPSERTTPPSISRAILERTASLDDAARTLAQTAAVAGRSFTADLLAESLGWTQTEVLDALGTLLDRGLVRTSGSSAFAYAFAHALFEAAIYADLPEAARTVRHRRIAAVQEQISDEDRQSLASIARHWRLAGEPARASAGYARAARAALDVYARDDAIALAREALALEDDARRRFDLLGIVVGAEAHHAEVDVWDADLGAFEALAETLDDEARFEALQARGRFYSQTGEREREGETIDAMLSLARRTSRDAWIVYALDARGTLCVGLGEFLNGIENFHRALEIALRLGDRQTIIHVRQHLIQILVRAGDTQAAATELAAQRADCSDDTTAEARMALLWAECSLAMNAENGPEIERAGREMLEIATRIGDRQARAKSHWVLGFAAMTRGEPKAVASEYGEAARLFEQLEQPQSLAATYLNLGVYYFEIGLFERGVDYYERAAALAEQTNTRNIVAFAMSNIAEAKKVRGNHHEAVKLARASLEVAKPTGDSKAIAGCTAILGSAEMAAGLTNEGLDHLRQALLLRRELEAQESIVDDLCSLVGALTDVGASEEVAANIEELRGCAKSAKGLRTPTRVLSVLSHAERLLGNRDRANQYQFRGKALLEELLARLPDEESRSAFAALAHNRALTELSTR